VKEFLSQNQIAFVNRDILTDKYAQNDLYELGYQTTPVTVIDGEIVEGFDPAKMEKLLDITVHRRS